MDTQLTRLITEGISDQELDRAKARYRRGLIFARDAQQNMAQMYGNALASGGSVEDIEQWPERIRAVTPEQVQAVASKYLDPSKAVTSYLLPPATGAQ